MRTIGFAGTAKNTGKTTTLLSVIEQMHTRGNKIALTSIGYDGEQRDTITRLPKPRYRLNPGDLVATASDCLRAGTAELKTLETTDIPTILGKIVISEVIQPGSILIAGPNRQRDLEALIQRLNHLQTDLLLVDGALNRLVPMIACDGLILSTGAAFTPEINTISQHAAQLVSFFQLPVDLGAPSKTTRCTLVYQDGSCKIQGTGSLLNLSTLDAALSTHNKLQKLILPGVINPEEIQALLTDEAGSQRLANPLTILAGSPLKMIASGHIQTWGALLQSKTAEIKVLQTLPLLGITVNSFYPRWLNRGSQYEPVAIDGGELLESMRRTITILPVFDIIQNPPPNWSGLLSM